MKPYKIALLTGTHQHRWMNDASGLCEKCHKEHAPHQYNALTAGICTICGAEGKCPHSGGFDSIDLEDHRCKLCYSVIPHDFTNIATKSQCVRCGSCNQTIYSHTFNSGICTVCGYTCPHENSPVYVDASYHKCNFCGGNITAHVWHNIQNATICRSCWDCGHTQYHTGITKIGDSCTFCGIVHSAHVWNNAGICTVCRTACTHETINNGSCSTCGMLMKKGDCEYYVYGGTVYDGCYGNSIIHNLEHTFDYYRIYKGWKWNAPSNAWVDNGYYMYEFNVLNVKTRFGGDYAYKLSGLVFSTSSTTVNVSPSLLSANGVYGLTLAQYELDGTLKASHMTPYTSGDCVFPAKMLPSILTFTP